MVWQDCKGDKWSDFYGLDLNSDYFDVSRNGVYIIWYRGNPGKTVYVGQGNIKARVTAHRNDDAIGQYSEFGLLVTWALVSKSNCDGIEAYLADRLNPLIGTIYPDATPIRVNLPW